MTGREYWRPPPQISGSTGGLPSCLVESGTHNVGRAVRARTEPMTVGPREPAVAKFPRSFVSVSRPPTRQLTETTTYDWHSACPEPKQFCEGRNSKCCITLISTSSIRHPCHKGISSLSGPAKPKQLWAPDFRESSQAFREPLLPAHGINALGMEIGRASCRE